MSQLTELESRTIHNFEVGIAVECRYYSGADGRSTNMWGYSVIQGPLMEQVLFLIWLRYGGEWRLPFLPPRIRRPCTVVFASDFLLPPPPVAAPSPKTPILYTRTKARNAIASCTIVVLVLPKGIPNILSSQATTSGWQRNSCFVLTRNEQEVRIQFPHCKARQRHLDSCRVPLRLCLCISASSSCNWTQQRTPGRAWIENYPISTKKWGNCVATSGSPFLFFVFFILLLAKKNTYALERNKIWNSGVYLAQLLWVQKHPQFWKIGYKQPDTLVL